MIVTINTDASFSNKHKIGTYAFWIVSNAGKVKSSGRLRKTQNSLVAEIQSIGNAVAVFERLNWPGVTKVIINTDCKFAIHAIEKGEARKRYEEAKIVKKMLLKIRDKYIGRGVEIIHEFRHVKAHNGTPDARSYVNDWCDKEAKSHMGQWLKEIESHLNLS